MRAVGGAVLGLLCWLLVGCSVGEPVPPAEPAAPQVQLVPQLDDGQGGAPAETFCLAPPGSGLRVFVSRDGHGRRIYDVENVHDLSGASPYRCP